MTWARLVSVGGIALLVTRMLIGSRVQSGEPSTFGGGGPAPKEDIIPPEQFIELDEILIEGALYDKADVGDRAPFDRAAALSAIRSITASSADCGLDAAGSINVVVTFAPSGEATSAEIENGPLVETPAGNCVAQHLLHARVPEFDGGRETVRTSLSMPSAKDADVEVRRLQGAP